MIKFQRHYVTNGILKARVHYHAGKRTCGRDAVVLYAKDYDRNLGQIMADSYKNDSDSMTDYFEKGRAVLFSDHPLYPAALARAEQIRAELDAKWNRKTGVAA